MQSAELMVTAWALRTRLLRLGHREPSCRRRAVSTSTPETRIPMRSEWVTATEYSTAQPCSRESPPRRAGTRRVSRCALAEPFVPRDQDDGYLNPCDVPHGVSAPRDSPGSHRQVLLEAVTPRCVVGQ